MNGLFFKNQIREYLKVISAIAQTLQEKVTINKHKGNTQLRSMKKVDGFQLSSMKKVEHIQLRSTKKADHIQLRSTKVDHNSFSI